METLARNLDLPLQTLKRWIRQGHIPIKESGNRGIFDESVLREWAVKHHLRYMAHRRLIPPHTGAPADSLIEAMQSGRVFYDIGGTDVETVLNAAVGVIPDLADEQRHTLFHRLLEREQLTSTGIGRGVAIPHPRTPIMDETEQARITTCFLQRPIDFNAVDDKPVFVLFILMSPTVKAHLHLLSRLAFCVRDESFVHFLRDIPETDALFEKIAEFENRLEE